MPCRTRWGASESSPATRSGPCSSSAWWRCRPSRERRCAMSTALSTRRTRRGSSLVAHPAAVAAARTVLPERSRTARGRAPVRQVREADGLEPILRLAVVWQRVAGSPSPPDPAGDALQARPRPARGRPGPRRPDRRRARAPARHARLLADAGAGRRPARIRARLGAGDRRAARLLGRERVPPAADDRHPLARPARRGTSKAASSATGPSTSSRCPTSARPSSSGWRRSATTSGCASTTSLASSARLAPRWDRPTLAARPVARAPSARAGPRPTSRRRSRATMRRAGARARRAGGDPAGRGVPARPGPDGRGGHDGPARRAAHAAGPLHAGARPATAAAADVRALPVRPAELRDHRLSTGPEPRR